MTGGHRKAEFLELNPAGKLPVLVDGDLVLNESAAIALYLAEKYPDRGLLPSDLRQRAEVYRWSLFAVTELEQPVWRIARHTHLYPEHERLPGDITLAKRDFVAMAAVLDNHMKGRAFVAGGRGTVARFIVAYTLDMGDLGGLLDGLPISVTELEQPVWRIARHTHLYPEHERLPGDITLAKRDFVAMAAVLDNHMKGRAFVAGDRVTVADFIVAYTLDMGDVVGLLDGFPSLQT